MEALPRTSSLEPDAERLSMDAQMCQETILGSDHDVLCMG